MIEKVNRDLFLVQLKDIFEKGNFQVSIQETKTLSSCCVPIAVSQVLIIVGTFLGLSQFGFLGAALILIGAWNIIKILNGEFPLLYGLFLGKKESFIVAKKEVENNSSGDLVLIFNLSPDRTLESPGIVTRYGLPHILVNALLVAFIFTGTYLKLQANYRLSLCFFLIYNVFFLSFLLAESGKQQLGRGKLSGFEQSFFTSLIQNLKSFSLTGNLFLVILTNDTCSAQTRKIFESYNFDIGSTLVLSLFETPEPEAYLLRQEGILFQYNHDGNSIDFVERVLAYLGKTGKPLKTAKVIHSTYYLTKKGFIALPLYLPISESSPRFLSKLIGEINKLRLK